MFNNHWNNYVGGYKNIKSEIQQFAIECPTTMDSDNEDSDDDDSDIISIKKFRAIVTLTVERSYQHFRNV